MRIAGALASGLAVAYLAWAQRNDEAVNDYLFTLAFVVVGAAAVLGPIQPLLLNMFSPTSWHDRNRDKIQPALQGLVWKVGSILAEPGKPADVDLIRSMGVTAWKVIDHKKTAKPLYPIGRHRFSPTPRESGIEWTCGKGIIGECWKKKQTIVANTQKFDAKHRKLTAKQWGLLPEETRRALDHDEYHQMAGKYGTVIAMPIMKNGKVMGVIALDAPRGRHFKKLDTQAVHEAISEAADLVLDQI
jgi:hypothetical protein